MEKEKTLILVLLDLCAFAYFQSKGERERLALEAACRLAENHDMPEERVYRDLLSRFEQDVPELPKPRQKDKYHPALHFPHSSQ